MIRSAAFTFSAFLAVLALLCPLAALAQPDGSSGTAAKVSPLPARNVDITLVLKRFDGTPAADISFQLLTNTVDRKAKALGTFKTDAQGMVVLKNLQFGRSYSQYALNVGKETLGEFDLARNDGSKQITITLAPRKGDNAPDFEVKDLTTGQTVKISSLRGQVVMLDFWATWCGPCQEPMKRNDQLVAAHKDWAGRVSILGVSIDDTEQKIALHVKAKGWNNVRQTWIAEPGKGWKSSVLQTYRIDSIPRIVLLDKTGKIVFFGFPWDVQVETEIAKLLAAK